MGSLTFTIPRFERPVSEILSRIPRLFKEQAERGFTILAEVGQPNYAEILQAVIVGLEGKTPPFDNLEKNLKLSSSDLGSLFAAAMLMVPILADGANPDDFTSSSVKAGLMDDKLVPKIKPFINSVMDQRVEIARAIRRATLSAQVLPHIADVDIVIDLRVAFEEHAITEAVPVAIVHIDTDVNGREIWFQSSKRQMQQLKSDIEEAIKKMETADTWGRREPKNERS